MSIGISDLLSLPTHVLQRESHALHPCTVTKCLLRLTGADSNNLIGPQSCAQAPPNWIPILLSPQSPTWTCPYPKCRSSERAPVVGSAVQYPPTICLKKPTSEHTCPIPSASICLKKHTIANVIYPTYQQPMKGNKHPCEPTCPLLVRTAKTIFWS